MSPCLALVAPTGMDQAERKTWLSAAHQALADLDEPTLAEATKRAKLVADHPAKLVVAIATAAEKAAAERAPRTTIDRIALPSAVSHETDAQREERLEIGKLMRGLVRQCEARD